MGRRAEEGKKEILKAELEFSNGDNREISLDHGQLVLIDADYEEISIKLFPSKGVDVGAGVSEPIQTKVYGGQVGIIFDGRGRPLKLSHEPTKRLSDLRNWSDALKEYPSLEV